jgi:putative transposase
VNNSTIDWKREYGGLRVSQTNRLEGLEQENARLKQMVADFAFDKAILQVVAEGNF